MNAMPADGTLEDLRHRGHLPWGGRQLRGRRAGLRAVRGRPALRALPWLFGWRASGLRAGHRLSDCVKEHGGDIYLANREAGRPLDLASP